MFKANVFGLNMMIDIAARLVPAVLGVVLACGGGASLAAQDFLYSRDEPAAPPMWVSASAALRNGDFDRTLFDEDNQDQLDDILTGLATNPSKDAAGCSLGFAYMITTRIQGAPPNGTLEQLATHYPQAWLGRIKAVTPGFYVGLLGSLVQFEPETALKGSLPVDSPVYLFLESARIDVEGRTVCKPGPRGVPDSGSQLLFFWDGKPPSELSDPVIFAEDNTVFFCVGDKVSLPAEFVRRLPSGWTTTFEDLLQRVSGYVAGQSDEAGGG